ncbi:MAG: hypothetical protein K0R30_2580 [Ornithinibacter sp.]|jgi:hypothetical protein|nr:hypothetical protein [Ornithinibacter sp.]
MGELVLPAALEGRAFTVAEARDAGVRPTDLRTARLHIPTRAVRCRDEPECLRAQVAAFSRALPPDAAFSHVTAARLLDLPLPRQLVDDGADLHVMRDSTRPRVRRSGCIGHRGLERRAVVELDGLRVVGPADTWVDLGEVVGRGIRLDDLVVAGDVVARRLVAGPDRGPIGRSLDGGRLPDHGQGALRLALEARVRPRGKALLAGALPLVRAGSRSPMETRARLMFHRAGFPEPELNADVRDAHGGWLLEGDLVWRQQRVVGEYQGSDHGSIRRRSADASRATSAEDHGYRVMEIFAEDVFGGGRRRACLTRFARAMHLDLATLRIG